MQTKDHVYQLAEQRWQQWLRDNNPVGKIEHVHDHSTNLVNMVNHHVCRWAFINVPFDRLNPDFANPLLDQARAIIEKDALN